MNDSRKSPLVPNRTSRPTVPPSSRRREPVAPVVEPAPTRQPRSLTRALTRFLLLILVPIAICLGALWFYLQGGRYVTTENAYVKANIVAVSADLAGRVTSVPVRDNQFVDVGAALFDIDAVPLDIAVAEAHAELSVVRNDIESLRAAYREATVEVAEAREQASYAEKEFERQGAMAKRGVGTLKDFDAARHDVTIAKRRIMVLRERVRQTLTRLNGKPDIEVEEHPRYIRAQTQLDRALDQRARANIKAPTAGIVSNMKLQVGEYVEDGEAVFSLIESDPLWIEANLKETQLTYIEVGQKSTFVADAFPGFTFDAVVETIAPATGAEFSLLPPQNASGNWVKVVQRVPVRLRIVADDGNGDAAAKAPLLRAGMTVSVSIDTKHERRPPKVVATALDWLGLSLWFSPASS